MELGDPRLDLLGMHIESGRTSWKFTCSGEQTKKMLPHNITVFSSILHMCVWENASVRRDVGDLLGWYIAFTL